MISERNTETIKERTKRIQLYGVRVHCISFADDTVMLSGSEKEIVRLNLPFHLVTTKARS